MTVFGAESRDGLCHGKIRLARTGGADADGDGVFLNGLQIILLADGLGLDGPSLGRHADDILGHFAEPDLRFAVLTRLIR